MCTEDKVIPILSLDLEREINILFQFQSRINKYFLNNLVRFSCIIRYQRIKFLIISFIYLKSKLLKKILDTLHLSIICTGIWECSTLDGQDSVLVSADGVACHPSAPQHHLLSGHNQGALEECQVYQVRTHFAEIRDKLSKHPNNSTKSIILLLVTKTGLQKL